MTDSRENPTLTLLCKFWLGNTLLRTLQRRLRRGVCEISRPRVMPRRRMPSESELRQADGIPQTLSAGKLAQAVCIMQYSVGAPEE